MHVCITEKTINISLFFSPFHFYIFNFFKNYFSSAPYVLHTIFFWYSIYGLAETELTAPPLKYYTLRRGLY